MIAAAENQLLERYLTELVKLSAEARLLIIGRLAESLRSQPALAAAEPRTLLDFAGLWANDPDADTIEQAIQNSRMSREKPELDHWDSLPCPGIFLPLRGA